MCAAKVEMRVGAFMGSQRVRYKFTRGCQQNSIQRRNNEFLFLVTNEYFRFSVNKVLACKNEDNCVTNLHRHNFHIVLNLIYTWYSIAK